jgi:hypothetical protein
MRKLLTIILLSNFLSVFLPLFSYAQAPSTVRVRGTITGIDGQTILFNERSGEKLRIQMPEKFSIQEVYPIQMSDIQSNSYIGTATLPNKNGELVALEVLVFPESMRGVGEGHYPWDLEPSSYMTNATVTQFIRVGDSGKLLLKYKDSEKTVLVPKDVPIVTFRPGSNALLVPNAQALIVVSQQDGKVMAVRATIGKDGFKPPM